jgi:hypothetical protein
MFSDVIKAVDEFTADQLRQLREYIQQREQQIEFKAGTLNMDELVNGLEEMHEIERAMNEEYIGIICNP